MKISIHEVKYQVDVSIVLGPDHILESDNILMAVQLLKENDFSESSLSISRILEGVKIFLKCNDVLRLLVDGFPHNTVGALA